MKLYYSPGACSLAPHIALVEAGLPFTAVKVDLRTHKLADGTDYYAVNPKGYVPFLELPDDERLSEVAVILQYIADRKPGTIAPAFGTMARYHVMEWLNLSPPKSTSSSLRSGIRRPPTRPRKRSAPSSPRASTSLQRRGHAAVSTGETFTVADAYLFTVVNWAGTLKVDLAPWPALQAFQARVAARPKVRETMKAEGLIKDHAPATTAA